MTYLNQDLGFDEVRWATTRQTSNDARQSFKNSPDKKLLLAGTRLYRLVNMVCGIYFDAVWWMPESVFSQLREDTNRSSHGNGRLLRNYVVQYMALPSHSTQLCVVEIRLIKSVYAWVGCSSPLFGRPGGMEQVYLPNLLQRGSSSQSEHASVIRTYWLKF